MLPFQKTSLYKQSLTVIQDVMGSFERKHHPLLKERIEQEAFTVTTELAKAFSRKNKKEIGKYLDKSVEGALGMMALVDLAEKSGEISTDRKQLLLRKLSDFERQLVSFEKKRKKILILTGSVGRGHTTAARAVAEAFEYLHGYDYSVEIVDIMEMLNSTLNAVSKTYYESSVKYAPGAFKFFYESTNNNSGQMMKLINQVNYPFVLTKVKKFFEEEKPDVVISTFPSWNYLASEIWKKYRRDAKFISIITDSIAVHNSWLIADTDYHIVANKDTADVIREYGIPEEKIKILGFPVCLNFMETFEKKERDSVITELGMNPKNFTVLFLPSTQSQRKMVKIIEGLKELKNLNIIVVTGKEHGAKTRVEKKALSQNMKIFGWTERMSDFIRSADLVITKAGGAIVMESIAAGKPMIITSIIPGQEQGNAELIKRYQLGIIDDLKKSAVSDHVSYIRENYDFFQRKIEKIRKPDAAIKIAQFVTELLEPVRA